MELLQQLNSNIRSALLCIEDFFNISCDGTDKIKVRYYTAAQNLNEVMERVDMLFIALSERISACDCESGAEKLVYLESILQRTTDLRKICETLLSDCESALSSKNDAERRIRMLADTALRKIKLL